MVWMKDLLIMKQQNGFYLRKDNIKWQQNKNTKNTGLKIIGDQ